MVRTTQFVEQVLQIIDEDPESLNTTFSGFANQWLPFSIDNGF